MTIFADEMKKQILIVSTIRTGLKKSGGKTFTYLLKRSREAFGTTENTLIFLTKQRKNCDVFEWPIPRIFTIQLGLTTNHGVMSNGIHRRALMVKSTSSNQ